MRLISSVLSKLFSPFRFINRRLALEGPRPPSGLAPYVKTSVGNARTSVAPLWRRFNRFIIVLLGFAVYFGLQYLVAELINQWMWWFIIGFFMVALSLLLAIYKPPVAIVIWLILSPLVSRIFSLDWGAGLPSITFDRVFLYVLATILTFKFFKNKYRLTKLLPGEWLLLMFPVYILATGPFFTSQSATSFVLALMQRAGDLCILYFVVKASITEKKHVIWILSAMVFVGIYCIAMGYYDHFTGKMSLAALIGKSFHLIYSDAGGRAAGPFLSPGQLGMYMGISISLITYMLGWVSNKWIKVILCLAIPAMAVNCFWTYTRGGYLLLSLSILVLPFITQESRKRYSAMLAMVVLAALVLVPIQMSADRQVRDRLTNDKTAKDRIVSGAALLNIVKHHPLFGVGLSNGNNSMPRYVVSTPGVPGLFIWQGFGSFPNRFRLGLHTDSHSTFLTLLAEHGILGGMLYITAFLSLLIHIWMLRKRVRFKGALGHDFFAMVAVIMVGYILSFNTTRIESSEYINCSVWVLVAMSVRLGTLLRAKSSDASEASELVQLKQTQGV